MARRGDVLAVVGEHGVHAVGNGFDERSEDVGRDARRGPRVELGEDEFRRAVDDYEEVELALLGPDLGDADVKEPDGIALEARSGGLVAIGLWQAGDAMALEAAMKRRARQRRNAGLLGAEAVIQRQQVWRRKPTAIASSSAESVVECGSAGQSGDRPPPAVPATLRWS